VQIAEDETEQSNCLVPVTIHAVVFVTHCTILTSSYSAIHCCI